MKNGNQPEAYVNLVDEKSKYVEKEKSKLTSDEFKNQALHVLAESRKFVNQKYD